MIPSTDTELGQASFLLSQLLEEAQNPTSQDAGPIILQKQEFDINKVTAIRVIKPDDNYLKPGADGTRNESYERGHELITSLIADGYTIVTMMVVREVAVCPTTEHKVNVILVKLRA